MEPKLFRKNIARLSQGRLLFCRDNKILFENAGLNTWYPTVEVVRSTRGTFLHVDVLLRSTFYGTRRGFWNSLFRQIPVSALASREVEEREVTIICDHVSKIESFVPTFDQIVERLSGEHSQHGDLLFHAVADAIFYDRSHELDVLEPLVKSHFRRLVRFPTYSPCEIYLIESFIDQARRDPNVAREKLMIARRFSMDQLESKQVRL